MQLVRVAEGDTGTLGNAVDVGVPYRSNPRGSHCRPPHCSGCRSLKKPTSSSSSIVSSGIWRRSSAAWARLVFPQSATAGAAVLEPSDEPGFLNSAFQADGAYAPYWGIYSGGTAEPASEDASLALGGKEGGAFEAGRLHPLAEGQLVGADHMVLAGEHPQIVHENME